MQCIAQENMADHIVSSSCVSAVLFFVVHNTVKSNWKPGVGVHTCDLSTWEAKAGQ